MKRLLNILLRGIITENPLLMLMIGLCSALAVTTTVANGIGMGLAMTFVNVFAELVISLFRKLIPNDARIPIFIIVIAAFTTIVDLSMKAYFPDALEVDGRIHSAHRRQLHHHGTGGGIRLQAATA